MSFAESSPVAFGSMHPKSVHFILAVVSLATSATAASTTSGSTSSMRQPLSYAPLPDDVYVAPVPNSTVTLLNFIRSRPELSTLAQVVEGPAGKRIPCHRGVLPCR